MGPASWQLHQIRRYSRPTTAASSPLLDVWSDLEGREEALGIPDGQPFLLRPDGAPDAAVLAYLNSASFRKLAPDSQLSYAKDLQVHLSFLTAKGLDWREVTADDFLDYEYWRRRDADNPRRIGGAKFARELAACRRFYEWQVRRGEIASSPVVVSAVRRRDGGAGFAAELRPRNVRSTRVKWLTPRAYRRWRDVGLGGYGSDGLRDRSWRGRNDGRNLAFADLLWSSGLRLREAATLLDVEVPAAASGARFVRARVGDAVAKGSGRDFWVSQPALQRIGAYLRFDRAEAVRRAQAEGRYDELAGLLTVTGVTRRRSLQVVDEGGRRTEVGLDQLDAPTRRRLVRDTGDGFEPLSLWLTEAGMPMLPASWETVFAVADRRCESLGVEVRCHPHMLRHSFALRMLVTLTHAFDRRLGLSPEERREYRMLFGDPFVLVQTMLGHRSLDTTRNIYLEPVNGLQVELFLNGEDDDDAPVSSLLSRIASDSPRINDGGDDER